MTQMLPIYKVLARKVSLLEQDSEFYDQVETHIENVIENHFPSGSGFDAGCTINLDNPKSTKLIIDIPFHCMNEDGYYDGWLYPSLIITPSLTYDYDVRINWRSYNGKYKFLLNEYFLDTFSFLLDQEIEYEMIDVEG